MYTLNLKGVMIQSLCGSSLKSGVCAVQYYESLIMFTSKTGRERGGVSNFEIRESDHKIFLK